MNNLNLSSTDSFETAPNHRRPYKAPPQLIEISLVEEKAVLAVCKSTAGTKVGASSSTCTQGGGSPCKAQATTAS